MKLSKEEFQKIELIARRAAALSDLDIITIGMDLTYCIEGGCSLRLDDMLNASYFDLMHDVYGINRHLDHETFQLRDCFLPRFAGQQK